MPPTILTALIAVPLVGAVLAAGLGRHRAAVARAIALAACLVNLGLAVALWASHPRLGPGDAGPVLEQQLDWIPGWGVTFHLALDGLSLPFVVLTALLGCVAVLASWRDIDSHVGTHYACILATLAGVMGVFLAWDLFLFYFLWELMLVPMYFLIGMWGHERRIYAALKFMLYTLISGLLLLVAVLGLYFAHAEVAGELTTDLPRLLGTQLAPETAYWLFLGFFVAFAVKLPVFPLHTWLPDAHTEAPTAGSILLAGLLLKTGGYGLIRFAVPLFPEAAGSASGILALLGAISILYGAWLALGQSDLKRMVAYSSVSHMGFVMLAVAVWNLEALQGAVVQMVAHGIATAALFAIAGMIHHRLHTREFGRLGGLWTRMPRMGTAALVFVLANVGLPGMGNFVGEFLVLLGAWRPQPWLVAMALAGIVVGTVAMLTLMGRTFYGPARADAADDPAGVAASLADLSPRESLMLGTLAVAIVAVGLVPQPILDAAEPALAGALASDAPFDPRDPEIGTLDSLVRETGRADDAPAGRATAWSEPDEVYRGRPIETSTATRVTPIPVKGVVTPGLPTDATTGESPARRGGAQ